MLESLLFLLGVLIAVGFVNLPSNITLICYTLFCLSLLPCMLYRAKLCKTAGYSVLVMLGITCVVVRAHMVLACKLPGNLENKRIVVEGYVDSIPKPHDNFTSFTFTTSKILGHKQKLRLRLSWYGKQHAQINVDDSWRLLVKLKRPHGYMNPGGNDYEKTLFINRIRATGYVVDDDINIRLHSGVVSGGSVNRLRAKIAARYLKDLHLPTKETLSKNTATLNNSLVGILIALAIGSTNWISAQQWQVFRNTGTSHLVAISGLHIGLVFSLIYMIMKYILYVIPRLSLYLPVIFIASLCSYCVAAYYAIIAGLSVPTQRSVIMLSALVCYMLARRQLSPYLSVFFALVLVLLINPLQVLSAGFILSFLAVTVLIYCYSGRVNVHSWWWRIGRAQTVVLIGLAPITLLFFNQISLSSLLSNVVAVPVLSFVIVPINLLAVVTMFAIPSLAIQLLHIAQNILILLWKYLSYLASLHSLIWHCTIPNTPLVVLVILGSFMLLAPRGAKLTYLGACYFLPLLFPCRLSVNPGDVMFTLLDVGQGLASVVRTTNHLLVYDTGPSYGRNYDTGQSIIAPFLRYFASSKINMLVVSHGDNDHIGGAHSLLQLFKTDQIYTSVPSRFASYHAHHCWSGQQWTWDGVHFEFLAPARDSGFVGNNGSCVLKITAHHHSIMLTGDIERLAEQSLLKDNRNKMQATIVVAPHHGSRTSSSQSFVLAVHPQYVLYPVGYFNRFRFPSKLVKSRYTYIGAKQLDTAHSGAISFTLNSCRIISPPDRYRFSHAHFWNSL